MDGIGGGVHTIPEILDAKAFLDDFDEPEAECLGDRAVVLDGIIEHDVWVVVAGVVLAVVGGELMRYAVLNNIEQLK